MRMRVCLTVVIAASTLALASAVYAQAPAAAPGDEKWWSVDAAIGLEGSILGNINSGAIGTLNGQAVVITKNTYGDVYGTGLYLRFGGGYMLENKMEVRATFSFQTLSADLTPMGDIGASKLYGQYTDYQAFGLDVGLRRYHRLTPMVQAYGEGTIGIGFVDKTDVLLSAPSINYTKKNTDFYDQTAAFSLAGNVGLLFQTGKNVGVYGQLGLRWVSGMAAVDDLAGTGLESINSKSSRTTLPFLLGVRMTF